MKLRWLEYPVETYISQNPHNLIPGPAPVKGIEWRTKLQYKGEDDEWHDVPVEVLDR